MTRQSFQFPANPSDGDIVVRGNLQAFYNAATNTWRVSEVPTAPGIPGPPGPPGPIGPPGQGITVSGSVDTEANLPAPNAHQYEFWVVDDTNTLYWSTGLDWTNLGSPIQGPQGIPGQDGADGSDGQDGRGWYDTSVDESNGEYKVTFLSNDGLTFTTDNLKGPSGNDGNDGNDGQDFNGTLPLATTSSVGVIQVGNGLDVDTAGVLTVDYNDARLEGGIVKTFQPIYVDDLSNNREEVVLVDSIPNYVQKSITIAFPSTANRAMVWWFNPTQLAGVRDSAFPIQLASGTGISVFRAYFYSTITTSVGNFTGGGKSIFNASRHNLTLLNNPNVDSISDRNSNSNNTKIDELYVPIGTDQIQLDLNIDLEFGKGKCSAGSVRLCILPFRDQAGQDEINGGQPFDALAAASSRTSEIPDVYDPATPENLLAEQSSELRYGMDKILSNIEQGLNDPYIIDTDKDLLRGYRTDVYNLRNLSGDATDVLNALIAIGQNVQTIVAFKFPFEP